MTKYQQLVHMFFALVFMITTASAQEYKVRMAMVGNSITYGAQLSDPANECYPAQLDSMLAEVFGDTCEIMNYGVSGRTMMRSAENPIWNEGAFKNALKYVPDICLILLGTNDSKPYRWDAWGDEFLDDYLAMVDTFKFRNPNTRFIVCYPPPIWEGHPYGTNFNDSHNDSIVVNNVMPAIDSVVSETGAILIDFHTPFTDSLQLFPDKLHPNALGSRYMAEIIYDTLIKTDLIRQIETGLAYVSTFEQVKSPVAVGSQVELRWTTIFSDSTFLDGVLVEPSGSIEIIAEENDLYTLVAKGPNNVSEFPLYLKTYIAEKTELSISTSSDDYSSGLPVTLYAEYIDQHGNPMNLKTQNLTWTLVEGNGNFVDESDTSIVFIPVETGKVIVQVQDEELTEQKTLNIKSFPTAVQTIKQADAPFFPNPVSHTLFLSKESNYEVYSFNGQLMLRGAGSTIPMKSLPNDLYFVQIDGVIYKVLKSE